MTNKEAAIKIIKKLNAEGFQALLAGGCVRDMLLKRRAKDYDVVTDAWPRDVMKLFRRTLKVGAKFGVVIVMMAKERVEVATFRTETGYADGRHPGKVRFATAAEDAARRDFTVNGMFYDPLHKEVLDFVGGRADLKKRLIRTIGRAEDRFGEDYLRMLRAVRFATALGFAIEDATFRAVCENCNKIKQISRERIAMELEGILTDPNRLQGAGLLLDSGLAEHIFTHLKIDELRPALKVLERLPERIDFALGLSGLFADCETDVALGACAGLRLSRNTNKHIKFLLSNRSKLLDTDMSLAQLRLIVTEPYFEDLYQLQKAIQKARRKSIGPLLKLRRRIRGLAGIELRPKPLLDGHDLIRLGAPPGPFLGRLAQEMYIAQLEGTIHSAEQAAQWVRKWLQLHSKQ
jgi:tRNA nucleotidyltransferase/poly(A) polymerase